LELEKIQSFLKNKHKFDRKKQDYEITEDLSQKIEIINKLIKNKDFENLDTTIAHFLLDLLQLCNEYNIDIAKVIKEKLKFGI
jgi:hypothetical protein